MLGWISYLRGIGSLGGSRNRDAGSSYCAPHNSSTEDAALPSHTSDARHALREEGMRHDETNVHDQASMTAAPAPNHLTQPDASRSAPSSNVLANHSAIDINDQTNPQAKTTFTKDEAEKRRNIGRVLVNLDPTLEEEIFGKEGSNAMMDYRSGRVSGLMSIHATSKAHTTNDSDDGMECSRDGVGDVKAVHHTQSTTKPVPVQSSARHRVTPVVQNTQDRHHDMNTGDLASATIPNKQTSSPPQKQTRPSLTADPIMSDQAEPVVMLTSSNHAKTNNEMRVDGTSKSTSDRKDTNNIDPLSTTATSTSNSNSDGTDTVGKGTSAIRTGVLPEVKIISLTDAQAAAELTPTVRADRDRVLSYEARIHEVLTNIEDTRRRYFVLAADALPCESQVIALTRCYEQFNKEARAFHQSCASSPAAVAATSVARDDQVAKESNAATNVLAVGTDTDRAGCTIASNGTKEGRIGTSNYDSSGGRTNNHLSTATHATNPARKSTPSEGLQRIASSDSRMSATSNDSNVTSSLMEKECVLAHNPNSHISAVAHNSTDGKTDACEVNLTHTRPYGSGQTMPTFVMREFSRCNDFARELRTCVDKTLHNYNT